MFTTWHPSSEGYVKIQGLWISYTVFGEQGEKGTIVCVHGGPGGTHESLLPMSDLTQFGYRVVLYDQMGCGKSEVPTDKKLLNVEQHLNELEGIRTELKLGKIHLMGESWGGMMGLAYALDRQANLKSLVVASGLASVPAYLAGLEKLRSQLPSRILETLRKYEAISDYENPEYLEAYAEFNKLHLVKLSERPPEITVGDKQYLKNQSHAIMWGPIKFACTGVLRYWDITEQIHKIQVPTLITSTKYDEVVPDIARDMHRRIKSSKLVIFEKGAHQTLWDEREKFVSVVRTFLDGVSKRNVNIPG